MREDSLRKSARRLLACYGKGQSHQQITERQLDVQAERVAKLTMGLRHPGMMLLDDPVGTGKTPVSLCVAKLLFDESQIDHALVVTPSDRVARIWHQRAKLLRLIPDDERWSTGSKRWRAGRLVVATQRTVPGDIYKHQDPSRTLVIIDEAHRGLSNEETVAFQGIQPLVKGSRVLLVTATPLQISPGGFLNMLTVGLDGSGKGKLIPPIESYAKAIKNLLTLWEQDRDTTESEEGVTTLRPAFEKALSPYRLPPYPNYDENNIPRLRADHVKLDGAAPWLRAYHVAQLVPELLHDGKGDMFQRRLVSCSEAFWNGSAGKLLRKRAVDCAEISHLADQLCDRLGSANQHPKVKATCDWVVRRVSSRMAPRHILIFCVFQETQVVLGQTLQSLLGEESVYCPNDQIQGAWAARFRTPPTKKNPPIVLIARDNLSESIDLDGGRPCIVHHDLPWNPARLQQRYGRVVRISTGFQRVEASDVFVPVLDTEVDRRMFKTLVHRCLMIQRLLPSRHGLIPHSDHLPKSDVGAIAPESQPL